MNIVKLPSYPLSFICFDKQQGQFLNDEDLEEIPVSEFFNKNPRYIVLQGVGQDQEGSLLYLYDIVCIDSEDREQPTQLKYYIISEDGELFLEPLLDNKRRLKYYPSDAQSLLKKQGSMLLNHSF
ncbi:hypothetical protein [Cellulophaga sp. BC115SP]|uniref:hypothetical protein n=1 Tax=Cellulophaga sp. BC115SP TaxID=2683263 RepID=UPI0014123BF9|nr:hypothetical protein [Cellulophaga sp. BC115SP]NBB29917.1 hypothetical protein [Cellulophaga sp. BC115SP]